MPVVKFQGLVVEKGEEEEFPAEKELVPLPWDDDVVVVVVGGVVAYVCATNGAIHVSR